MFRSGNSPSDRRRQSRWISDADAAGAESAASPFGRRMCKQLALCKPWSQVVDGGNLPSAARRSGLVLARGIGCLLPPEHCCLNSSPSLFWSRRSRPWYNIPKPACENPKESADFRELYRDSEVFEDGRY